MVPATYPQHFGAQGCVKSNDIPIPQRLIDLKFLWYFLSGLRLLKMRTFQEIQVRPSVYTDVGTGTDKVREIKLFMQSS